MDERRQAVEATTMVTAARPWSLAGLGCLLLSQASYPTVLQYGCSSITTLGTLTRLVPPPLCQFTHPPFQAPTVMDHWASFHLHPWVKPQARLEETPWVSPHL